MLRRMPAAALGALGAGLIVGSLTVWQAALSTVVALVVLAAAEPLLSRLPWRGSMEWRTAMRAYWGIERALGRMRRGDVYFTADDTALVSAGSRWKPRMWRLAAADPVRYNPAEGMRTEYLAVSSRPPRIYRVPHVMPLCLDPETGRLMPDLQRFNEMMSAVTEESQLAASRLAVRTGTAWLDTEELVELAQQLKVAAVRRVPPAERS